MIKRKYLSLQDVFFSCIFNNICKTQGMFIEKILLNTKRKLSQIFNILNKHEKQLSDRCENITSIPGIGTKNCNNFYEAGYLTPESIISATDEELLSIPGVGISFIKKLRKTLG